MFEIFLKWVIISVDFYFDDRKHFAGFMVDGIDFSSIEMNSIIVNIVMTVVE